MDDDMKVIDSSYGNVTLRECFDADESYFGEGFVEVSDEDSNVIAEIHGYDIDEIDVDNIDDLIHEYEI